jgi:hypothetical protein
MKWEVQVRVLQAFGRVSSTAQRSVDPRRLSEALNNEVSHYTVGLNHGFWADCGWLKRLTRGEYAAAPPLVAYTNHLSVGNEDAAREALRPSMTKAWFWRAIEPQVRVGAPMAELLVTLMTEAGVGQEHRAQLNHLVAWLRYAGLVRVGPNGRVTVADGVPASDEGGVDINDDPDNTPDEDTVTGPSGSEKPPAEGAKPTTGQPSEGAATPRPLLTFDVSLTVTPDDLARLAPEQIKALFEGAAAVASIKNALTS